MSDRNTTLSLDAELKERLAEKAAQSGRRVDALAADILYAHLEADAQRAVEIAADDQRWQRYVESGQSIPQEIVRAKLKRYAAEAAQKADAQ